MKLHIALVVLSSVAVAMGIFRGRCIRGDDCYEDECCVAKGPIKWRAGFCTKLANEGESCSHPDHRIGFFGGKYHYNCPCINGLDCVLEDNKPGWFGAKKRKCVASLTTTESEEPTTEPEELTTELEELVTESEEPVTEPEEPVTEPEEPVTEPEKPVTEPEEPVTEPEEPVTEPEEPITEDEVTDEDTGEGGEGDEGSEIVEESDELVQE